MLLEYQIAKHLFLPGARSFFLTFSEKKLQLIEDVFSGDAYSTDSLREFFCTNEVYKC